MTGSSDASAVVTDAGSGLRLDISLGVAARAQAAALPMTARPLKAGRTWAVIRKFIGS